MNSSPLAAIWHWYPLLAWVACARFCSLPLGSLSYLNFYLKLRLDSNFSYGTGLKYSDLQRIKGQWKRLDDKIYNRLGVRIAPPHYNSTGYIKIKGEKSALWELP